MNDPLKKNYWFQLPPAVEQGEAVHGLVQQGAEGTLQEAR